MMQLKLEVPHVARMNYLQQLDVWARSLNQKGDGIRLWSPGNGQGWELFGDFKGFCDPDIYHAILPSELAFDFDCKDDNLEEAQRRNLEGARLLVEKLEAEGIPSQTSFSGGKSLHVSIYLDLQATYPPTFLPRLKRLPPDFHKSLRPWLAGKLMGQEFLDTFAVDLSLLNSSRHVIRSPGSRHPKTGRLKTYLPGGLPANPKDFPQVVHFPPIPPPTWRLPDVLLAEYLNFMEAETRATATERVNLKTYSTKRERCVNYLLTHYLPDGKKRATFFLCGYLKRAGFSREEALEPLRIWNNQAQKGEVPDSYLRAQVEYTYANNPDRPFAPSCRFMQDGKKGGHSLLADIAAHDPKAASLCKSCIKNKPLEAP